MLLHLGLYSLFDLDSSVQTWDDAEGLYNCLDFSQPL